MPRTLGIIAEYDPFHNGHAYCLEEAKRQSGCDRSVCVMSGPFLQRGDPARFSKYLRAEAAVRNGVDLVLELPFAYSSTGAQNFARGGVRLLAGLHMIDAIAFGSESATLDPMKALARELAFEKTELSERIRSGMKDGMSYPAARHLAIKEVFGEETAALIEKPNDILAIEYLKQIIRLETEIMGTRLICYHPIGAVDDPSGIEVYPIPRKGSGELPIASAASIRDMLREGQLGRAFSYMPEATADLIRELIHGALPYVSIWDMRSDPDFEIDISRIRNVVGGMVLPEALVSLFQHSLITMDSKSTADIYSVSEGIENKFYEAIVQTQYHDELIAFIKSKRYTETHVRRLILHTALRVTKQEIEQSMNERMCSRILAFNDKGAEILRELKDKEPSIVLYQNMRLQEDELAPSATLLGLSMRADMIHYMLQKGSLSGFRYSPEPVRI